MAQDPPEIVSNPELEVISVKWLELLREEGKIENEQLTTLELECDELIAIMVTMSARSG